MRATNHAVLIVGGGPTGLMLAGELALAGVDVAIVERRANQQLAGTRAGGLHSRTIEVLDQRGIAERFLSQGQVHRSAGFALIPFDISDFPTRHNYLLALTQNHIERILAEWVGELAVTIYRECEVTGFTQDEGGVDATLSNGQRLRAQYLVGCDGGRGLVRKTAGIDFPGLDPTMSWLIAEVEWTEEPTWGMREDAAGTHGLGKMDNPRAVRVVLTERQVASAGEPTLRDISEALIAIYGTDFGIHSPIWISRFTDMSRQAATYRVRRVLLAGDAAHVHPPMGGQGLNIGVQDAVNLGWKLAQVVRRTSPDSLLDTYHAERPRSRRAYCATRWRRLRRRPDEPTKRWARSLRNSSPWVSHADRMAAEISRSRRSLRHRVKDTRCSGAACPISTWSCKWSARVHPAAQSPAGVAEPGFRQTRHQAMDGSASVGRRPVRQVRGSFRHLGRSRLPTPC